MLFMTRDVEASMSTDAYEAAATCENLAIRKRLVILLDGDS